MAKVMLLWTITTGSDLLYIVRVVLILPKTRCISSRLCPHAGRSHDMTSDSQREISIRSVSNLTTNPTFSFERCDRDPTLWDLLNSIRPATSRDTGLRMSCTSVEDPRFQATMKEEAKDFAQSIENTPIHSVVDLSSSASSNVVSMIHDAHLGPYGLVGDLKTPLLPLHKAGSKKADAIHQRRLDARAQLLRLPVHRQYRLVQQGQGQNLFGISGHTGQATSNGADGYTHVPFTDGSMMPFA
jgi:hypothetical protein